LNGSLASAITLLTYLSQLNLSRNRLQGTLPLDIWYLPQLARLDLSHNKFSGGLSSAVQ
jgi:Leucine-rich repeat (LRR) protein